MDMVKESGFGTISIHGGSEKNPFGALAVPIYQTSTFVFDSVEQGARRFALEEDGYIYSRLGNPTATALEKRIALLEGAEAAVATSSGMGAISAVLWTVLKAGDHIIADKTLYGCTFALLSHGLTRFGIEVEFIDTQDLQTVKKALKKNTKVVFLETPANPNLKIIDIKEVSKLAHDANKDTLVVVDNTFATPYCLQPLKLGADIVVHSATKYLNGHGDVIVGLAMGSQKIMTDVRLVGIKDMTGAVISPMDAYLTLRGMKTLEVRMQRHCKNAEVLAKYLNEHEKVKEVFYPGLKTHKNHKIALEQMTNFGGLVAIELDGGFEAGKILLNNLKLCSIAVSLGDTETLIQHPASMTHSPYTKEERLTAGITDGLVRISVGLENIEDIISDLEQALKIV